MVSDFRDVCERLARLANVDSEAITSRSRRWPLTVCRDILFQYYREKGLTTTQVGALFGRDHATVLSGIKRLKAWLDAHDKYICELYDRFGDRCG